MKIAIFLPVFPELSHTFIFNQITGLLDLGHEIEIFSMRKSQLIKKQHEIDKYNLLQKTNFLPTVGDEKN